MNARIARLFCTVCSTWRNFEIIVTSKSATTLRCDGCRNHVTLGTREFKVGQRV